MESIDFFQRYSAILIMLVLTVTMGAISFLLKSKLDIRKAEKENDEIKEEVSRVVSIIDTGDTDVLKLMIKNVAELREYYVINKQQARNSFSAALFISVLGFILFAAGVIISYYSTLPNIIQYSTIGGAVVEIIAGLFFWLYSKAITQINLFHTSLLKTEKFLTAIQLVDKISPENRDKTFSFIISKIISEGVSEELVIENPLTPPKADKNK
jgi:hypothetical protein